MRKIAEAILERVVPVSGQRGGHVTVDPPTTRTAMRVLASLPGYLLRDVDESVVLFEALREWLPKPIYALVNTLGTKDRWELRKVVLRLVYEGVDGYDAEEAERDEEGEDDDEAPPKPIDWQAVLAEYCYTYHQSPDAALDTPFALFLMLARRVDQVQMRNATRLVTTIAAPFGNKAEREAAWAEIKRRAGFEAEEDAVVDLGDGYKYPRWMLDRQRRNLKHWGEVHAEQYADNPFA